MADTAALVAAARRQDGSRRLLVRRLAAKEEEVSWMQLLITPIERGLGAQAVHNDHEPIATAVRKLLPEASCQRGPSRTGPDPQG